MTSFLRSAADYYELDPVTRAPKRKQKNRIVRTTSIETEAVWGYHAHVESGTVMVGITS